MPIASYQYHFFHEEGEESCKERYAKLLRCFSRNNDIQEWLCLPYPDGLELFMVTDVLLSVDECWNTCLASLFSTPVHPTEKSVFTGRDAVSRFLQIATGLAGTIGGKQRLEIMQEAYLQAIEQVHIGPMFHRLFQRGIWLYEKARQETTFFQYAVETEMVVRELVEKILAPAHHTTVQIIGAHPMLPRVIKELKQAGCQTFCFAASEVEIDHQLVSLVGGTVNSLPNSLSSADIWVIFPSVQYHVTDKLIAASLKERGSFPLLIIDFAESPINRTKWKKANNLFIYTPGEMEEVIRRNRKARQKVSEEILHWIREEVDAFFSWYNSEERYQFAGIIGATPEMQRIFELISRIARSNITVLIDGESGTGKELVAKAIHQLSNRSSHPFVVVNCGAIPENLLESELFGYVRGAFTGAVSTKQGLFEAADAGTIFLDEIGELPPHLQVKLLRVLQDGEIKRVGSNETIRVDVRVLAATNKDLEEMVSKGDFRSDLFYRLNVIRLTIPPLRERKKDIPLLAEHFVRHFSRKLQKEVIFISPEALQALERYHWPGNVRELENVIERAVALAIGKTITMYELPPNVQHYSPEVSHSQLSEPVEQMTLKELEKKFILQTLEACDWNYEQACRQLAIGRTTLWRKLREYNIPEKT